MKVPESLKSWFVVHCIIDLAFAIPLVTAPVHFLMLLGFPAPEPLAARLVGAALIGIGGASFLTRNKTIDSYDSMLTLKLLWSSAAIIAAAITLFEGGAPRLQTAAILIVFAAFFIIWLHYKLKLKRKKRKQ